MIGTHVSRRPSGISSIQPAIDPHNKPGFLLDWELTLKCNLDCFYCGEGTEPGKGHSNSANHPPLNECLDSIDFFYNYVDVFMQTKAKWNRLAVLNVYGGESLLHPDIVEILQQVHNKHTDGNYDWPLTVITTTNAIIGNNRLQQILPFIDDFTLSYHEDQLNQKQKQLFKTNALTIKNSGKRLKIIVLMTTKEENWPGCLDLIEWCNDNDIDYLPRSLDGRDRVYSAEQLQWLRDMYSGLTNSKSKETQDRLLAQGDTFTKKESTLSSQGRACCGGRSLCINKNLRESVRWIPGNNFQGWHCSVNHFFVYLKQHDGRIFTNKDCLVGYNNKREPIGHLSNWKKLVEETKQRLTADQMPYLVCPITRCQCGLCAPKAETREELDDIMKIHISTTKEE
jgi:hypothetical protein